MSCLRRRSGTMKNGMIVAGIALGRESCAKKQHRYRETQNPTRRLRCGLSTHYS